MLSRLYQITEHRRGFCPRVVDEAEALSGLAAIRMYEAELAAYGNKVMGAKYTAKLIREIRDRQYPAHPPGGGELRLHQFSILTPCALQ